MIAFIKGILDTVLEDRIYVDNRGVGFEIFVPGSVFDELPPAGNEVKIYTYMHVREELMQLYGFLTRDELEMFKLLITVNGVGPKGALGVLTVMDVDALRMAIISGDAKAISKAPGIGGKTASKVILELKDKCNLEDIFDSAENSGGETVSAPSTDGDKAIQKEAIEALTALGYSASEATTAVRKVKDKNGMSVEELLKQSLKQM